MVCLGYVGLAVLIALLLRFHRRPDGLCCALLYGAAGRHRALPSIHRECGSKRLEACGILRITRRLVRETIDGGGFPIAVCRQGSNLYAIHEPAEHADRLPVQAPAGRSFPCAKFAGLAKMLGWNAQVYDLGAIYTIGFQYKRKIR